MVHHGTTSQAQPDGNRMQSNKTWLLTSLNVPVSQTNNWCLVHCSMTENLLLEWSPQVPFFSSVFRPGGCLGECALIEDINSP